MPYLSRVLNRKYKYIILVPCDFSFPSLFKTEGWINANQIIGSIWRNEPYKRRLLSNEKTLRVTMTDNSHVRIGKSLNRPLDIQNNAPG